MMPAQLQLDNATYIVRFTFCASAAMWDQIVAA